MAKIPDDVARRYHPSSYEQKLLSSSLQQYFSYPERSPDRSRIARETSNKLMKISSHWTNRAVRLWFNNNKKIIDKCTISSLRTPIITPGKTTNVSAVLNRLEDEAAWTMFNSPRIHEIVRKYNYICTQQSEFVPETNKEKTSNFISFEPPPKTILPLSVMELMNPKQGQKQRIWWTKKKKSLTIPKTEVNGISNGYAAFVTNKGQARVLTFLANPEFSSDWRAIPLFLDNKVLTMAIGSTGLVWMISSSGILNVNLKTQQQSKVTLSNDIFTNPCIDAVTNYICISSSNKNVLYFIDEDMNTQVINLAIPCKGVSEICSVNNKIVCSTDDNAVFSLVDVTGKEVRPFVGHKKPITKISKINENCFCTCSKDKSLKLWDIREPRTVATFYAEGTFPISLSSSSDTIVAGYSDNKLRAFDIRHKQAKAFLGVNIDDETPSTICFNQKLDALSMFSSSSVSDNFTVISPFAKSDN